MLQLPQKKGKLWEDLMISALSLDCKLLLDELTDEKIGTLENLCAQLCRPSSPSHEQSKAKILPKLQKLECCIADCHLEALYELKVAQDLNKTLEVWAKISQEETDSLEKQGLLLSSGKYTKANSPYSLSAITATTKCTDNNLITPTSH